MTTNYGARPGLEHDSVHCACGNVVARDGKCVECAPEAQEPREGLGTVVPRTMSAEREAADRSKLASPVISEMRTALRRCFAELDAERAAHRATLETVNEIMVNMTNHADKPICAYVQRACRAALASAAERGAK